MKRTAFILACLITLALPGTAFSGQENKGINAKGEVHSLYVAPGHIRQGLGTQLLGYAMAQASARGVQRFSAWATPFSRPVFERAGLRLVQTVTEPYQGVLFERYRLASP